MTDTAAPAPAAEDALRFGEAHRASPHLVVYGSLKRNGGSVRSDALDDLGARYIGPVTLHDSGLVSVYEGRFPTLQPKPGGRVNAEVWSVPADAWVRLDGIESHPHFYRRELVTVRTGEMESLYVGGGNPTDTDDARFTAWLYTMVPAHLTELTARGAAVPFDGSDWVSALPF